MRSRAQAPGRIDRLEADEGRTVGCYESRAPGEDAADEVLPRRHHPFEPEVAGRGLSVELVSGDVPLLDAQHAQRLRAVRARSERFSGLHERANEAIAKAR